MADLPSILAHLTLPFPPSVNCLYKNGGRKGRRPKSDRYLEWILQARQFVLAWKGDNPGFIMIREPIVGWYRHSAPDESRTRDVSNYEKAISDLLKDERIIEDDSLIKMNIGDWADDIPEGYTDALLIQRNKVVISIL